MPRHGGEIWAKHEHVRSGTQLSAGERASDVLKHWFGTWTLLGFIIGAMVLYLLFIRDPGELRLNLALSCMAAVQGIVLQIASNRIDRVNAEAQLHHVEQTEQIRALTAEVHALVQVHKDGGGDG